MNDIRITEYALGELRGSAREEFEKELAASEELQNELREMTAWCERITELSDPQETLRDDQRISLREECLKNTRIVRRQIITRRAVVGALAALAACLVVVVNLPKQEPMIASGSSGVPNSTADKQTAEKIAALLAEGRGYYDTGRYDLATKRYEEVLNLDHYNIPARRGQEQISVARAKYAEFAYANTRGDMLRQVDKSWELPIRRFDVKNAAPIETQTVGKVAVSDNEQNAAPAYAVPVAVNGTTQSQVALDGISGGKDEATGGLLTQSDKSVVIFHKSGENVILANTAPTAGPRGTNYGVPVEGSKLLAQVTDTNHAVKDGLAAVPSLPAVTQTAGQTKTIIVALAATAPLSVAQERDLAPESGAEMRKGQGATIYAEDGSARIAGRLVKDKVQSTGANQDARYQTMPPTAAATNESYQAIIENPFLEAKLDPLSTFSTDVDTASYANVRRMLQSEQLPPADAIRIEEMINYFPYSYPQPQAGQPFSVNVETSQAPWNPAHKLVRIGLKGRDIPKGDRSPANLVFLLDVSGSMEPENRLPLIKRSLEALVQNLSPQDHVAIVVYAGSSGLVLPSTPGTQKERILEALERLQAGGSTNGADGIKLAYQTAQENFLKNGNNRVILCTDGDFNVGVTSQDELVKLIERERNSGIFLSVLGVGEDNLKDSTMMNLADKGNGNYAYVDTFAEGRKVLVEQMGGTLFTIAKDVKIQVEFNPAFVAGYRLIGYEKRLLAKEDFNDDKKDAGEIGAGHTVTALYEIIPAGQQLPGQPSVDPLKYQVPTATPEPVTPVLASSAPASSELLTVKLRYKAPTGDKSELIEVPVQAAAVVNFDQASPDFQFAAAVAAFGMKLRHTPSVQDFTWKDIQSIARRSLGDDNGSYRAEFLTLVEKAAHLDQGTPVGKPIE